VQQQPAGFGCGSVRSRTAGIRFLERACGAMELLEDGDISKRDERSDLKSGG